MSSEDEHAQSVLCALMVGTLIPVAARVTSYTGDTGRNGMYHAAPGRIFRAPQGLSVIF